MQIVQSVDTKFLIFVLGIIAFSLIAIGCEIVRRSSHPRNFIASTQGKIGFLVCMLSIAFLIGFVLTSHVVPQGYIGIDKNGQWYQAGTHLFPRENIMDVSRFGTIAFSNNSELQYSLSENEIILLDKGIRFPEYLRDKITVNRENGVLENVPEWIDSSHLVMTIKISPSFLFV